MSLLSQLETISSNQDFDYQSKTLQTLITSNIANAENILLICDKMISNTYFSQQVNTILRIECAFAFIYMIILGDKGRSVKTHRTFEIITRR